MADNTPITAKAHLDASEFSTGVIEMRKKITELNAAFAENRAEMKQATIEINKLERQKRKLAEAMEDEDGATEKQQEEMQQLSDKIAQVAAKIGVMRTKEELLKAELKTANSALLEQKNNTDEVAASTSSATSKITGFATAVKTAIAGYTGKKLYEGLIGSNAEMEQYLSSFEVMLGDAEKAAELMDKITDFAAVTPMEIPDITSTATLLMNYGVGADELIDKMNQLGNLASGNAAKFDRISLAYGQMLAKNKVTGEELRQMTEAGVPLLSALADSMGKSTAEVQKLISDGSVGIDMLDNAIASLTTGTGKFAGMMEKQSQTFNGMLSNLADNAAQFGRDVGAGAFDIAKESLSELLDLIEQWREDGTLEEIAETLGTTVETVISILKSAVGFIWQNKEAIAALAVEYGVVKATQVAYNAVAKIGNALLKEGAAVQAAKAAATTTETAVTTNLTKTQALQTAAEKLYNAEKAKSITLSTLAAGAGSKIKTVLSSTKFQLGALSVVLAAVTAEAMYFVGVIADVSEEVKKAREETDRITGEIEKSIAEASAENEILKQKAARYEELRTAESLTADEQKALNNLAADLKEALGGEIEVVDSLTGKYNDLSSAVEGYIKKKSDSVKLNAYENAAEEAYANKADIERKMEERTEEFHNLTDSSKNPLAGAYYSVYEYDWIQDMAAFREELARNDDIIADYEKALSECSESAESLSDETASVASASNSLSASFSTAADAAEELSKTTDDIVRANESLADGLNKAMNGEAVSYSQLQSLAKIYPEIAQHIKVTADGYIIEASALGDLNDAFIGTVQTQLAAEREKTQAAINGTKERIEAYKAEMSVLARKGEYTKARNVKISLEAEYETLNSLQATLDSSDTVPDYLKARINRPLSSASGKADSTEDTSDPYETERSELKYNLDMDIITEKQYYVQLARLRDKYLEENSEKWRSVNVEIHKYKENLKKSTEADSISEYETAQKDFELYSKKRLDLIDEELKAKQKLRDETLAAIDAEVEARKRLTEDNDIQKEIDAVTAQLRYAQLDGFSRMQLEKELQRLQEEQANIAWERSIEDRKSAANAQYEAAEIEAEKSQEAVNAAIATVKEIMASLTEGITNITNVVNNAVNNNTVTNNSTANISFASQTLTIDQIIAAITRHYGI